MGDVNFLLSSLIQNLQIVVIFYRSRRWPRLAEVQIKILIKIKNIKVSIEIHLALVLYFLLLKQHRIVIVLLASIIFYGASGPLPLTLLLTTVLCGYAFGVLFEKRRSKLLLVMY